MGHRWWLGSLEMYGGGGSSDEFMGANGGLVAVLPVGGLQLVGEGKRVC